MFPSKFSKKKAEDSKKKSSKKKDDEETEDDEDTDKRFLVNAPKMQLGIDRNGTPEPITKADELELILKDMMQATADYADLVAACGAIPPLLVIPTMFLKGRFKAINGKLKNFKSEKSFTI